jgi:predicted SAM-dependent methyltransferase
MASEAALSGVCRLHWGCGDWVEPGWINADVKDLPGLDLCCDIREGLPLPNDSIDYAVSVHALPELTLDEQVPALRELQRVLRPGGVLRLVLPDLDLAVDAYRRGDREFFLVPDERAESLGAKLVVQLLWYGFSKTVFTFEFVSELLAAAGFSRIERCRFRETASAFPEIVSLDNRPMESLFVEAVK